MNNIYFLIGTLSGGGAERVVSNLSLNISDEFSSKIIIYGDKSKTDYPYKGEIVKIDDSPSQSLIKKVLIFYKRRRQIKLIKKESTIVSFLEYPNLLNSSIRNSNTKTIISIRNHMSTKHSSGLKSFAWKKSFKIFYQNADLIVACSEEIKKDLVNNFGLKLEKIKVIYNFYDIERINSLKLEELEEEYKIIFDKPVIISSGRLSKQKGFTHLIKVFFEAKKVNPDLNLVILGEGPEEKKLKKLVSELELENDVFFLGFQKNPFKFIFRSKIYFMSSKFEGFPNALAEAMVCGIPVISTDCLSGPREILAPKEIEKTQINYGMDKERFGILVSPFKSDKEDSLDASNQEKNASVLINELLENKDLYAFFSKQSKIRVKDFSLKNTIEEWEKILS